MIEALKIEMNAKPGKDGDKKRGKAPSINDAGVV
jgi:hypothetical protein